MIKLNKNSAMYDVSYCHGKTDENANDIIN